MVVARLHVSLRGCAGVLEGRGCEVEAGAVEHQSRSHLQLDKWPLMEFGFFSCFCFFVPNRASSSSLFNRLIQSFNTKKAV